jgi:hypothetical protein
MSDQDQKADESEQAYPGHGPHADDGSAPEGPNEPLEGVEANYPVTPGTETPEERAKIADEQRAKLAGDVDDEDEDDDPDPEEPAADSPIHGESTIQPGATDPNL